MILSVTFARSISAGPFAGGSDTWSHKKHFADARDGEKVACVRSSAGVVLSYAGSGEYAGKTVSMTIPAANIVQIVEVEEVPVVEKRKP